MSSYVELHARSAFSFLRGASSPEEMVGRAAERGLAAVAVLDRDGVQGSARAQTKAAEVGVRALVGAAVTVDGGSVVPVLVKNRTGYQALCRLLTDAHLRAPKGGACLRMTELESLRGGVIALSGDEEGPVRRALARHDMPGAEAALRELRHVFGNDHVAVEVQRHRHRGEAWTNRRLVELAHAQRVPLVATGGALYHDSARRPLHDAFTALRHHTTLDQAGLLLSPNGQRALRTPPQMAALFADVPEAVENTARLAEQLEFSLGALGYEFPRHPSPEDGGDMAAHLRRVTFAGAADRFGTPVSAKVRAQLDRELDLISRLGFCGYFLIVWELVQWAKARGIFCQGRGSAANSAVCYALGITNVDPIRQDLLFERFLSEGRNSWPDIDIDFPSGDQRESVIQEVYRRFGPRGAAMTANVITYRGRSAMREMSKVLGIPADIAGRFSDLHGHGDFPHTLELREQLRQAGLPPDHPRRDALIHLYQSVLGLPRHLGQHSGGMIICDRGLDHYVPLENASMPGRVVVQWDKDDCEDLGIIKVDLLGLGMLAAIEDSLAQCEKNGRPVDMAHLPQDDPPTYELMCRADTIGLFQIESRAQQATLPRMKPECFYDVVIETALIRPGPIVGKLVHPYLNRRAGRERVDFIAPEFEPVLKRTLGVPLFQEQVLKMAMIIADFTGSEAEELRRALSFHRSNERMQKVMTKLRAAMAKRGVPQEIQDRTVQGIQSFALYGFPESHAISFALIAYASAWMKVHRPPEFYAGLLNAQPMGFYSPSTLVRDARAHGVTVKPPCVAASDWKCLAAPPSTLRLGLNQVRGLSRATGEALVSAREKAPFASLDDLLLRVPLDSRERRLLAKVGAFATLTAHRRAALWRSAPQPEPDLFSFAAAAQASKQATSAPEPSVLPVMSPLERLEADYSGLGLTVGKHPMGLVRDQFPHLTPASHLRTFRHGQRLSIGGLVVCRQRPGTAKGHVFISLEDETGIANAFVPSATFEKHRLVITQEPFLLVKGHLQHVDGVISLYAREITGLPFHAVVGAQSHDFR